MSKFNYAKQFAKKEETPVKVEVKDEVVTTEVVEELPKPVQEPVRKTGVVSNCEKLRVRRGPSKQTSPATIIDNGCEVAILSELADWYKVGLSDGLTGYCMREFITIK